MPDVMLHRPRYRVGLDDDRAARTRPARRLLRPLRDERSRSTSRELLRIGLARNQRQRVRSFLLNLALLVAEAAPCQARISPLRAAWISAAASRPWATAVTVRSSPAATQSPPAQTRSTSGAAAGIGRDPPGLDPQPLRHRLETLADGAKDLVGRQAERLGLRCRRLAVGVVELDLAHRAVADHRARGRAWVTDPHAGLGRVLLLVSRTRPCSRARAGRRA